MPEMASYPPGTPSWVDLATSDLDAAIAFYTGLFGWTPEREPNPEAHGYTQMTLNGKSVAGVGPVLAPDQPVSWTTYIAVADVEETLAKATAAGGTVLAGPIKVFEAGRLGLLFDTTGAAVGLWQPKQHIGAQLVNEPGTLCWNELTVRDIDAAKQFYGAVFGWEGKTSAMGGVSYTEWALSGKTIGGMMQMNEMWPAEVPSHWMVYFAVTDTDAAAAKTEQLGGKISVPPTDIPPGRFAVLNDPQGGFFSIITMAGPPQAA